MKKFLKEQLQEANYAVQQSYDSNNMSKSQKTSQSIEHVMEYLYGRSKSRLEASKLISNAEIDLNPQLFEYYKELVMFYNELPLLETESVIEYPVLLKCKSTDRELLAFINSVYNGEGVNISFNPDNTKIFKPSLGRRLTLQNGECYILENSLRNKKYLILEKANNVTDFIAPCNKGIELITDNLDINSDMESFFMKSRAIKKFKEMFGDSEAGKLHLLQTDSMIMDARQIYNYMLTINSDINKVEWEDMHYQAKARLIHFANKVLGGCLASFSDVNLSELIENPIFDDNGNLSLESIGLNKKEVKDIMKIKTKYLKNRTI